MVNQVYTSKLNTISLVLLGQETATGTCSGDDQTNDFKMSFVYQRLRNNKLAATSVLRQNSGRG